MTGNLVYLDRDLVYNVSKNEFSTKTKKDFLKLKLLGEKDLYLNTLGYQLSARRNNNTGKFDMVTIVDDYGSLIIVSVIGSDGDYRLKLESYKDFSPSDLINMLDNKQKSEYTSCMVSIAGYDALYFLFGSMHKYECVTSGDYDYIFGLDRYENNLTPEFNVVYRDGDLTCKCCIEIYTLMDKGIRYAMCTGARRLKFAKGVINE